jgi:hypothetical protein
VLTVEEARAAVQAALMPGVAGDGTVTIPSASTRVSAGPRRRRKGPGGVDANPLSPLLRSPTSPGLVLCAKTGRKVPSTLGGLDGDVLSPAASDVLAAARSFGPSPYGLFDGESPLPRMHVTPGALILTRTSVRQEARAAERARVRRLGALAHPPKDSGGDWDDGASYWRAGQGFIGVAAQYGVADEVYSIATHRPVEVRWALGAQPSRRVTGFSAKSRSNMVKAMASLDWTPVHSLGAVGRVPAMVTLTYPADWQTVAPAGHVVKRHVWMWLRRYRRAWGDGVVGAWKLEFQARGAPHIHIFMCPPHGRAAGRGPGSGLSFRHWLSLTWAGIVDHPDPVEYQKHLAAGTAVDFAEALKCKDPKRLAIYFGKHGMYRDKEYQNTVPALWREPGASPGRFWGYWGLRKVAVAAELSEQDYLLVARTVRRWSARVPVRACSGTSSPCPGRVHVPDCGWKYVPPMVAVKGRTRGVDESTGEVVWRKQRRRTRVRRLTSGAGYVLVNDAPAFAHQLARLVAVCGDGT